MSEFFASQLKMFVSDFELRISDLHTREVVHAAYSLCRP